MELFGVYDYIVLSLVLIMSASIGVYYRFTGGKQKTNQVFTQSAKYVAVAIGIYLF